MEEERARDLFYGLWIPDLFMLRVEKDQMWSLFCPTKVPGLQDAYGTEFNFKTQTAGKYTLEIRDHFKTLISKSIINAEVGDNVIKFYTKALQNSDYTILIKKDGKTIYNLKYNIQ